MTANTAPKSKIHTAGVLALRRNLKLLLVDLLPALVIFSLLTCYQLRLPGLYADEALDAVPTMQLLAGQPLDFGSVRNAYLPLAGLRLPLMNSDYQGVVATYGLLPFLAFGFDVVNLRLFTIFTGLIALALAYALTKELFGRPVAVITVLLFAVAPSWVFWSRIGIYVVAQVVPITLGVLLCLLRWWRGGRDRYLYAGAFLLGLGFSTKFLFLWLPVALFFTYGLLSASRIRKFGWYRGLRATPTNLPLMGGDDIDEGAGPRRRFWRNAAICAATFVVGAFPFLYYNLLTRGTYIVLRSNLDRTTYGVQNSDLLANLYTVVRDYQVVMDGSYFWFQAYAGQPPSNSLYPMAYLIALAGLLLGCIVGRSNQPAAKPRNLKSPISNLQFWLWLVALVSFLAWMSVGQTAEWLAAVFLASFGGLLVWLAVSPARTWYQRPICFITLLVGLLVAQSAVTVSGLWPTHLVITLPIPQMTIAVGIVVLAQLLNKLATRFSKSVPTPHPALHVGLAVLLVAGLIVSEMAINIRYHSDLQKIGGYVTFSDAIYALNDYLLEQDARQPVALDWGFRYNLQVLSGGRLNPLDAFQYEAGVTQSLYNALTETLKNPANLYLFHVPEESAGYKGRKAAFLQAAQAAGREARLERQFTHRDGGLVYEVWSAR